MQSDSDFVEAHEPLVQRIVERVRSELNLSCEREDMFAYARVGLIEARARFDAERGVRFSTFAYYRVRGAVIDGVRASGYVSRRAYAKLKAAEAADDLAEQLGQARTGAPAGHVSSVRERARQIDDVLGKISAAFLLGAVGQDDTPQPSAEDKLDARQTHDHVRRCVEDLPDKERTLVQGVYFEGLTLEQSAKRVGISKSWASRVHAKALARLREQLEAGED